MWLWNRWLGRPTKRDADKKRLHTHKTHRNAVCVAMMMMMMATMIVIISVALDAAVFCL